VLIYRLAQPNSFPPQVLSTCGIEEEINAAAALAKRVKLAPLKGAPNVVELKAFADSPQAAQLCAQAIFELIKTTQAQIVAPYIADAKMRLDDDIERLQKTKELLTNAEKSSSAMNAAYLFSWHEIRLLLDEITALRNVVIGSQSKATRLIVPIYAGDVAVAPKKLIVLTVGLFGGLLVGLLIALADQMWVRLKSKPQEQQLRAR